MRKWEEIGVWLQAVTNYFVVGTGFITAPLSPDPGVCGAFSCLFDPAGARFADKDMGRAGRKESEGTEDPKSFIGADDTSWFDVRLLLGGRWRDAIFRICACNNDFQ